MKFAASWGFVYGASLRVTINPVLIPIFPGKNIEALSGVSAFGRAMIRQSVASFSLRHEAPSVFPKPSLASSTQQARSNRASQHTHPTWQQT